MKMPWGKYKGEHLADIPESYIRWVLEECTDIGGALEKALEDQLTLREGKGVAVTRQGPSGWDE